MEIDFGKLALAEQVFDRQGGHSRAIKSHLREYGSLSRTDMGAILQLLIPLNAAALAIADQALDLSAKAFDESASRMAQTRRIYLDAERTASAATAVVAKKLDLQAPAYREPAWPVLGAARSAASDGYGQGDNDFGKQLTDLASGLAQQGRDAGATEVDEASDVRSFLVVPQTEESGLDSIRWSAGAIFGGVDWVWEKLFGYSLLEEITKPFTGDWTSIQAASLAWEHAGDALGGLSQNAAALMPPMATWTGKGSEAFLLATAAVSEGHDVLRTPTGAVSSMLSTIHDLSRSAAEFMLKVLRSLERRLIAIATEAAVPLVGWAAALITTGISLVQLTEQVKSVYDLVQDVCDTISEAVSTVSDITDSLFRMSNLLEGLSRAVAARA